MLTHSLFTCLLTYLLTFPDRTPPSVRFTNQPNPLSKNPTETFTWRSNEPVTFSCKADERETDCGQGIDGQFTTANLPDGEHVFQVILHEIEYETYSEQKFHFGLNIGEKQKHKFCT